MPKLTLLDIEKRSGNDTTIGMIEEIGLSAPEVTQIAARTISGTSYKTFIRTGVPRIGFRLPNAPASFVTSTYENRNVELFPISTIVFADNIILSGSPDGEAAVLADETSGVGQGCLLSIGAQMFYGKRVDSVGFYGLDQMIDDSMILSADPSKPADSNDGTSVYAVVEGPRGVQLVTGNDRGFSLGPFSSMLLPKEDGAVPGKGASLDMWVTLANHSRLTAARLKNIGDAEGTTLNDKLLNRLINKFPAGTRVTSLFMNSKALLQLQESRPVITVSANGGSTGDAPTIAPTPSSYMGIPIYVTDSIQDNESDLSGITGISHWGKFAK